MSTLVFDETAPPPLTLPEAKGRQVGQWHVDNVVDHRATLRFVPNRTYSIIDQAHSHNHGGTADTLNGTYGRFGILGLEDFTAVGTIHCGVGIHAGRADQGGADQGGADHATMGCIRTSDEAMAAIVVHILGVPIVSITVPGNHDQHNWHPRCRGDHHYPRRPTHRAGHGAFPNTPLT